MRAFYYNYGGFLYENAKTHSRRTISTYLKNNFTQQEQENFCETVDYLGVFDKKAKYLRKNNVAVIVALAEQMLYEGIEASDYKNFLNEFFASDNEDYKFYSGSGNVKKVNVEARYEILRDECYKYFKLELPSDDENSELVSDDASSDGSEEAGADSDGDSGESYGEE